jgi:hypothetical protein
MHAARQAVEPLHMYGAHGMLVAARQTPMPLQVRPVVSVDWPAGQVGAAHDVAALYSRQAPLPSQNPSVPQLTEPWSEQRVSLSPAGRLLHTPREVFSAHDLQMPVQADAQQMPCSQKPDRHSFLLPQVAPFGLRPQEPFTHTAGDRQSPSAMHDGLHCPVPQVYGKQVDEGGVTHAPVASHCEIGVNWLVVDGHAAVLQVVPVGHFWQAPAPSHLPFVPQVDASCATQRPAGSFSPAATFQQTPSMPATHDLQAVSQAELQQTP